jgi:hypothetical protein
MGLEKQLDKSDKPRGNHGVRVLPQKEWDVRDSLHATSVSLVWWWAAGRHLSLTATIILKSCCEDGPSVRIDIHDIRKKSWLVFCFRPS